MVGEHVTDLISNYAVFQNLEGLPEDICNTIFPHPTLSEGVQEAIFAAIGRPLHM
jgi:dihydrolipoamide dehydrogenase